MAMGSCNILYVHACIGACMQGDASDQFLYSKQNLIGKVKCSYSGIYGIDVCIAIYSHVRLSHSQFLLVHAAIN